MAKGSVRWEIRLLQQPPLVVRLPADRDLAAEWHDFHKGRRKPPATWQLTDGCAVITGIVLGVQKLSSRGGRRSAQSARPVGFRLDGDGEAADR